MNIRLTDEYIKGVLPKRAPDGNKGTFGRVLLVCGNKNMRGAAALATLGALRCGAGLVTLASTREVIDALSSGIFEAIWLDREKEDVLAVAKKATAIGFGCGMGTDADIASLLFTLLSEDTDTPLVIDADGLNILASNLRLLSRVTRPVLLTPHPLEFSRLTGLSVEKIQASREETAREFASKLGVTLLLKGKDTVITDGDNVFINPTGSSALAKGGSGDVLTGMICAFLAQGASTLNAATIAAYCHGKAGEELAKIHSEYGVLASELPKEVSKILCKYGEK